LDASTVCPAAVGTAHVEFGDPIAISPELVEKFKAGGEAKRQACGELLTTVGRQSCPW